MPGGLEAYRPDFRYLLMDEGADCVKEWQEQWKQQGLEEGRQKGLELGLEQGREQGRAEGEAAILLRLLERRFGADAVEPWHLGQF